MNPIMKKSLLLILSLLSIQSILFAQINKKVYVVFENKALFQMGLLKDSAGNKQNSSMRFAPFANLTLEMHKDLDITFGIYTGIGVKNVGFIYKPNDSINSKVKSRAYSLCIPIGFKYGNIIEDKYLYVSAELLIQLGYKEKAFTNDGDISIRKNLYKSNPINIFNYCATIGYNYKGYTIGVEYTLGNFYDPNYRFQPDKANAKYTMAGPSKSNILTFFFGFRTNLSKHKAAAPEKQLQQASMF
jgi:hypothetical protein